MDSEQFQRIKDYADSLDPHFAGASCIKQLVDEVERLQSANARLRASLLEAEREADSANSVVKLWGN